MAVSRNHAWECPCACLGMQDSLCFSVEGCDGEFSLATRACLNCAAGTHMVLWVLTSLPVGCNCRGHCLLFDVLGACLPAFYCKVGCLPGCIHGHGAVCVLFSQLLLTPAASEATLAGREHSGIANACM